MKLQCGQIKRHRLQSVVVPASQHVTTTAAGIYMQSQVHTASVRRLLKTKAYATFNILITASNISGKR